MLAPRLSHGDRGRASPRPGETAAAQTLAGALAQAGDVVGVTRSSTVRAARLPRCRPVELANLDELQPEALHALEQPVQRILVVDRPAEDRLRRLDLGVETFQPRRELLPDSSLDAN